MKGRSQENELLDNPDVRPEELLGSLNFMRQVNELFGGHRTILEYFSRQDLPKTFTVLDIACGGGDIPCALAKWARVRGKEARITAIDLQPLCVAYAQKNHSSPDIQYLLHSAFDLERLGRFDYVMSSMFFHHLPDEEIVKLLGLMSKTARRGWIVNDLYRGGLNYAAAWFLGMLSGQPMIFNDAKLSVARAFRPADFERYRQEARLPNAQVRRRPIYRMTLSGHGQD